MYSLSKECRIYRWKLDPWYPKPKIDVLVKLILDCAELLHTLLASAKSAEVGSGCRNNIVVELEDNAAQWATIGSHLEEYVGHDV